MLQKQTELEAANSAATATTQKLRELETELKEKGEELEQNQKELEEATTGGLQTQLEQKKLKYSRDGNPLSLQNHAKKHHKGFGIQRPPKHLSCPRNT